MAKPIVSGLQLQTAPPLALPAAVRTFISNQGESSQYNYSQLVNSFSDFVNAGTATQLPTPGLQGRHFFATDSNTLWLDNGNTQQAIPVGYYAPGQLQTIAQGVNTTAATINVTPPITSYTQILNTPISVKFVMGNTGPVTININNLGVIHVVKNLNSQLISGDIPAGGIVSLVYDGTNFQAISGLTGFTPATAYGIATGGNAYSVTVTYSTLLSAAKGFPFIVQFTNSNTGAGPCTLAINGLAATPLRKNMNQELTVGDILNNNLTHVIYDGTQFQLQAPNGPAHRDLTGTASGTGLYNVNLSWNPTSLSQITGIPIQVRFANSNANSGPQLQVNSLPAATIVAANGSTLAAGQINANVSSHVIFNGIVFFLQSGYTISVAQTALTAGANITISGNTISASAGAGGVTSATGGTGVNVSPTTGAVTVTNTGVTSLTNGSGISLTGSTGAIVVSSTVSGITAASLGSPGYVKFANGLIIQWGTHAFSNVTAQGTGGCWAQFTVTYPISFSSGAFTGYVTGFGGATTSGAFVGEFSGVSANQGSVQVYNASVSNTISDSVSWLAIGV